MFLTKRNFGKNNIFLFQNPLIEVSMSTSGVMLNFYVLLFEIKLGWGKFCKYLYINKIICINLLGKINKEGVCS